MGTDVGSRHADAIGDLRLQLGEGPVWDARIAKLYCVDIERHKIFRICPETGDYEVRIVEVLPAALGLCKSGKLLVACRDGVKVLNFDSGEDIQLCNPISHRSDARLNDGKVAPDGSFWVGSMQNNIGVDGEAIDIKSDIGGFFRVTADGKVSPLVRETLGIANTLAWSPNGQYFYYADSMKGALYRADCDGPMLRDNALSFNKDFPRGVPDGSAMDENGYLWNARWGGNCVVRFAPDGTVEKILEVPATNVTSCAFGGARNQTLFITTAQSGLAPDHLARNSKEGAIFALETGICGMEVPLFDA